MTDTPTTICLIGARGGSGTTTLALLLAHHTGAHHIVGDTDELQTLATATHDQLTQTLTAHNDYPHTPSGVTIIDGGTLDHPRPHPNTALTIGVIRGPSYIATRHLTKHTNQPDALIIVSEPDRALTLADIADATKLPVIGSVAINPAIARAADAGLLLARTPQPLTTELARLTSQITQRPAE